MFEAFTQILFWPSLRTILVRYPRGFTFSLLLTLGVAGFGLGPGHKTIDDTEHLSFASERSSLRFYLLGGTGGGGLGQRAVADAVLREHQKRSADAVWLLGNNFRRFGVQGVYDPQWESKFESMYPESLMKVPFFAVLGRSDHRGDTRAQIDYSEYSSRWMMPAEYYSVEYRLGGETTVEFFVIDSCALKQSIQSRRKQMAWLRQALQRSEADWNLLVSFNPLWSNSRDGDDRELQEHILPILRQHPVDMILSASGETLEVMKPIDGVIQLVSGTGSSMLDVLESDRLLAASHRLGFLELVVSREELRVRIISRDNEEMYSSPLLRRESGTA